MKKIIIILLLSLFVVKIHAQQVPIMNQPTINKYSITPAFAGYNGNTECFIGYRQSWAGIEGAPTLTTINLNGRLNDKMGYGINVNAQKTGNFRHFFLEATYAHHIEMGSNMLSFGLTPKVYRNQIDLSAVKSFGTIQDPLLQNNGVLAGTTFDIGLGINFNAGNLNAGISIPQTIGMKIKYKETPGQYQLKRHYMVYASYQHEMNDLIFEPMFILRTTEKSKMNYEIQSLIKYKKNLWTALSYRAGNNIAFSLGGALSPTIVMHYSYEFGFGGLSSASSGTHELSMGFLIKRAGTRKEPTIFPEATEEEQPKKKKDPELEKKLAELDKKMNEEITKRTDEIKRLEDMIKKLNIVADNLDAKSWKDPFILNNIKFGNNSDKLFSSSYPELNKLVKQMQDDADLRLKISGYTDNVGSPTYNQKLSERRAKAVADYIISQGIDSGRLEFEGKGDEKPIGSNDTPEGRSLNRRIEAAWNK